ncbi:hypothetical protein [Microbacterium xanthum]|uniref:hypothetical protein n=1 Tax=Microbacterium xanthum TaxID=3079794 RepID=UPI002AD2A399|nr:MULTISPECIES: hypothetical protein [unclassified Microbacterium]MDZ8170640.1 hypothetical protein [Microbacterium sp. KSW-48]MDZ8201166.1 hypothetical protein [Microbacterium sp. SSW1-59]
MHTSGAGLVARVRSAAVGSTPTSSSSQRTYRYLRIGAAATVLAIFTAIGVASLSVGILPSVSAYYFSPARDAFVGSLIAASLALFALSGHGLSRALLDAAALFAPLIALVPTASDAIEVDGSGASAVDLTTSVATYLIVGAAVLAVAVALAVTDQTDAVAAGASLAVAAATLLAVAASWWLAPAWFTRWAHPVATVVFFSLIAGVAVLAALTPADPAAPWLRRAYIAIAALLLSVGIVYAVVALTGVDIDVPLVLLCEVAALALFMAFWILQTVQHWTDHDPALRA